ncbi:MAG TPA: cob(I)yrinic acid a,c-diamide adenosyltransferase [Candidatus Thermoplasmatota archaeon]|nr:cob(I)yrinic acid a,c-diamide adenosyltransferase [Candidatus Thermoplasmatota archaeon]
MSRIATGTGDKGETGLADGRRVRKTSLQIEAFGAVDELNAALGVALAAGAPRKIASSLRRMQRELFDLGADLSSAKGGPRLGKAHAQRLDAEIDVLEAVLPPLRRFVLPGGSPAGSHLHFSRTVCRRAERAVIRLREAEPDAVAPEAVVYLNRLSDLLFLMAREANHEAGVAESEVVF